MNPLCNCLHVSPPHSISYIRESLSPYAIVSLSISPVLPSSALYFNMPLSHLHTILPISGILLVRFILALVFCYKPSPTHIHSTSLHFVPHFSLYQATVPGFLFISSPFCQCPNPKSQAFPSFLPHFSRSPFSVVPPSHSHSGTHS